MTEKFSLRAGPPGGGGGVTIATWRNQLELVYLVAGARKSHEEFVCGWWTVSVFDQQSESCFQGALDRILASTRPLKDWWWLLSPRAGHRNCPKRLRLLKHTDMTIHWKALEEHLLMVPLVFLFNHFRGMHFLNFSQKTSGLQELIYKSPNIYKFCTHFSS
jgi:hypothetical protein